MRLSQLGELGLLAELERRGLIAGVEKVLATTRPDTKFIPGHGPLSSPDDVRKFVQMIKETRALVADAVKKGKTLDQMKQGHLLSRYEADYGKGFLKADDWMDQSLPF